MLSVVQLLFSSTVIASSLLSEDLPATRGNGVKKADFYPLSAVVGSVTEAVVTPRDTLVSIAQREGLGVMELRHANPGVDTWLPAPGSTIVLPTRYVLPAGLLQRLTPADVVYNAHESSAPAYADGQQKQSDKHLSSDLSSAKAVADPEVFVVINLPEFRLYLVDQGRVSTRAVSIGKSGFPTPLLELPIGSKARNPEWRPTESIRKAALQRGEFLAALYLPGPGNPLGDFALRLGQSSYLIHGTNRPSGLGMRVSHGCVRMYPQDIRWLFEQTQVGDRVKFVHEPIKAGWQNGELYLEVHQPLAEYAVPDQVLIENAMEIAFRALLEKPEKPQQASLQGNDNSFATDVWLNDQMIRKTVLEKTGIPVKISMD